MESQQDTSVVHRPLQRRWCSSPCPQGSACGGPPLLYLCRKQQVGELTGLSSQ